MKKNIWIFNHYSTNMYFDNGGRHYWFAKYLKQADYNPVIFCANTLHGFDKSVDTNEQLYIEKRDNLDRIPFVFVKTPQYKKNGISRINNMLSFYFHLFKVAKSFQKEHGKPDIILASSVHPLTLVAGIQIARKLNIPCICEVRDLWPESIVAYGRLKEGSLLSKLLYKGEKWIYKNAAALIFTMEGGKDYIKDKKWDRKNGGRIDLGKVYYINNGIDLTAALENKKLYPYKNEQFDHIKGRKIIYTGSIREVNDIGLILDAAKLLHDCDITFCIFGDGEEREKLERRVTKEQIDHVIFFGKVDKKYIPDIVSKAALLLLLYAKEISDVAKYGMSQNKLFDYLASGQPIVSNLPNRYSIINKYDCGIEKGIPTAELLAGQIRDMIQDEKNMYRWGENSKSTAKAFSFEEHTKKLITIIEKTS